jgi:ADP-heptose:LPS heptosyltransferase
VHASGITLMFFPQKILISRTDSIGDVMLTLPLATILKKRLPECYIGFLGKNYTRPVIDCCSAVNEFIELNEFLAHSEIRDKWDAIIHVFPKKEIALKALQMRIPWRIGTISRPYHWLTCNRLIKLKRKNRICMKHNSILYCLLHSGFVKPSVKRN